MLHQSANGRGGPKRLSVTRPSPGANSEQSHAVKRKVRRRVVSSVALFVNAADSRPWPTISVWRRTRRRPEKRSEFGNRSWVFDSLR